MDYKIKKAELKFDKEGHLESITTTAEMPGNPKDVRKIQAKVPNVFWNARFALWNVELQKILQVTTGQGSEV